MIYDFDIVYSIYWYISIDIFWFWWVSLCQVMQTCDRKSTTLTLMSSQSGGHLRYDDIKLVWCCWTVVQFQVEECRTWHTRQTLTYWTRPKNPGALLWAHEFASWEDPGWTAMEPILALKWHADFHIFSVRTWARHYSPGEYPIWWSPALKIVANKNRLPKYQDGPVWCIYSEVYFVLTDF